MHNDPLVNARLMGNKYSRERGIRAWIRLPISVSVVKLLNGHGQKHGSIRGFLLRFFL